MYTYIAVRNGDLAKFSGVVQEFVDLFQQDHTYTLIIRLHHNVIKTGIRIISLSYSRISLRDIAEKLGLDDSLDAEYIVAKVVAHIIHVCATVHVWIRWYLAFCFNLS